MRRPDPRKHFPTLKGENPGGLSFEQLSVGSNKRNQMAPRYATDVASDFKVSLLQIINIERCTLVILIPSKTSEVSAAGAPSLRPVKGSGSFQFETSWHIEMEKGDSEYIDLHSTGKSSSSPLPGRNWPKLY